VNAEYYKNKVGIINVWSKDQSIEKIHNYFSKHDLINDLKMRSSRVKKNYNSCELINKNITEEYKHVINKIEKKIKQKEKLAPFENAFLLLGLKNFEKNLRKRSLTSLFMSCFIPSRLFIDVDGNFHICNVINHKFPIGDTKNGFNLTKINKMLIKSLNLQNKYCSTCDVKYLCTRCYIHFASDGKFEMSDNFCKSQRKGILEYMNYYVKVKNEGIF